MYFYNAKNAQNNKPNGRKDNRLSHRSSKQKHGGSRAHAIKQRLKINGSIFYDMFWKDLPATPTCLFAIERSKFMATEIER